MANLIGAKAMSSRYMETSNGFTGDRTPSGKPASKMSNGVERCMKQIVTLAEQDATTAQAVAEKVLKNSDNQLTDYIVSKKSVPKKNKAARIMQAALLRMDDIATVANASQLSDDEAEAEIMEGESEALGMSHPDSGNILSQDIQASLKTIYSGLVVQLGAKDVSDAVSKMNYYLGFGNKFDNAPGANLAGKFKSNNFDISDLLPDAGAPTVGATVVANPTPVAGSPATSGDDGSSLSDIIGSIVGGVGNIAGTVKSTANALSTTGANIGADSINLYLKQYGLTIVIVLIVIVLVVILIARASTDK